MTVLFSCILEETQHNSGYFISTSYISSEIESAFHTSSGQGSFYFSAPKYLVCDFHFQDGCQSSSHHFHIPVRKIKNKDGLSFFMRLPIRKSKKIRLPATHWARILSHSDKGGWEMHLYVSRQKKNQGKKGKIKNTVSNYQTVLKVVTPEGNINKDVEEESKAYIRSIYIYMKELPLFCTFHLPLLQVISGNEIVRQQKNGKERQRAL